MAGDVAGQKAQELSQNRVLTFGCTDAGQHDFAAGAVRVVNLVRGGGWLPVEGIEHRYHGALPTASALPLSAASL
jgi:hypothetical protein